MKDPRPIREKAFQYSAIKSLIKFLAESSYDHPISPKILSSPSAKDFQSIFKFLYACLDPAYTWSSDKKFEEEVPYLMKGLRYPFANDISKSHLYAVGSMHAWPSLLAMLQWMVDLILVRIACFLLVHERSYLFIHRSLSLYAYLSDYLFACLLVL